MRGSKAQLVLVLLLIGWEGGACFAGQSQSEVKQNQSKGEITFDPQLKSALIMKEILFTAETIYSATSSTGATQHWSANHRSHSQQRSLALVVCKSIKNKNIPLNFKVLVFSVASVEFVAL